MFLRLFRAEIVEIEIDLAGDLIVDDLGNVDAAGLGQCLQRAPRC